MEGLADRSAWGWFLPPPSPQRRFWPLIASDLGEPDAGPAQDRRPERHIRKAASNPRVLLVDDDELVLAAMGALLAFLDQDPTAVASGEEALQALTAGLAPSLVILDLDMPGIGGPETLGRIRGQWPDLPVLISTGRDPAEAAHLARHYPGVALLPKPASLQDLAPHLA